MKRLVYIAGAGHSGTTMLGLILGQHSRLVGQGEVFQVLRVGSEHVGLDEIRQKKTVCSCGNTLEGCAFWGKVDVALKKNRPTSYGERFEVVLDIMEELFGRECLGVDTSKSTEAMAGILNRGFDVRVIHLIKDVRAYTISYMDRAKVRQSRGLSVSRKKEGLSEHSMRYPAYYFLEWYSRNRRIQQFLQAQSVASIQVGYEELCLYPSLMIGKICEFLGISMEPGMLTLENSSHSHIIRGNRMRHSSEKKSIRYDNRWFYRTEWVFPSIILPHIMRFNRREVYKNTAKVLWEEK